MRYLIYNAQRPTAAAMFTLSIMNKLFDPLLCTYTQHDLSKHYIET